MSEEGHSCKMEGLSHLAVLPGATNRLDTPSAPSDVNVLEPRGSKGTCQESQSLKIIDEVHLLYANKLKRIDDEVGDKGTQLKIETLQSWINALGEQNAMLIRSVEELEERAADRVMLLEESLQRSSRAALEYMTKLHDYDGQVHEITSHKVPSESNKIKFTTHLEAAKSTELHERVANLQNDVSSLLGLIRRARQDGSWDATGLTFKEVTLDDIFGSYPYQMATPAAVDLKELESKERRILELEQALKDVQKELKISWDQLRTSEHVSIKQLPLDQEKFGELQKETDSLASHLQERDDKMKLLVETAGKLTCSLKAVEEELDSAHASAVTYDVDNHGELLTQDQTTSTALMDTVKELLRNIRHRQKVEDSKSSRETLNLRKKPLVSFAVKSSEEYELQIKQLQKSLKEAQNEAQQAKSHFHTAENGSSLPAAILFGKEIEEYRIKTVEAQAALEEMKDEIDSQYENIKSRESQVVDLENMVRNLQETLSYAQKDMSELQQGTEEYVLDDQIILYRLQGSLNRANNEIENIRAKAEDYSKQKEQHESVHLLSEQKLEKLQLELESTQEALKQMILTVQDSVKDH